MKGLPSRVELFFRNPAEDCGASRPEAMFQDHEMVRLSELLGEELKAGIQGTIVMVYQSEPPEYEVEFFDEDWNTLAVRTVRESQLERLPK